MMITCSLFWRADFMRRPWPDARLWIVRDDEALPVSDIQRAPGLSQDRTGRMIPRLIVEGQVWRTSERDDPSLPLVDSETVTLCHTARGKPHVAIAHTRAYHAGKGRRQTISWGKFVLPIVTFAVEFQDGDCEAKIKALFAEFSPKGSA
jgi:hypothetical protein